MGDNDGAFKGGAPQIVEGKVAEALASDGVDDEVSIYNRALGEQEVNILANLSLRQVTEQGRGKTMIAAEDGSRHFL